MKKKNRTLASVIRNANKHIEYVKLKKHINETPAQTQNRKYREYVKCENRERCNRDKQEIPTHNTTGTKKEYQHTYPAKSQWKWEREYEEKMGKVKPEIVEIKERDKKTTTYTRKEYILLYDREKNEITPYYAEIEKNDRRNPYFARMKRYNLRDEETIYENITPSSLKNTPEYIETYMGKMKTESILKIALKTGVNIYEKYVEEF